MVVVVTGACLPCSLPSSLLAGPSWGRAPSLAVPRYGRFCLHASVLFRCVASGTRHPK